MPAILSRLALVALTVLCVATRAYEPDEGEQARFRSIGS
jgi:hypothetical protein